METLNKNAFAISLIAVIFGLLGFVIGRQSKPQPHGCPAMKTHCPMNPESQKMHLFMMEDHHKGMEWVEEIDVKKESGEEGEKQIKIKVKAKED